MLRIAIDFDQTLFPTFERVLEIYNKNHGTEFNIEAIPAYNLYECFEQSVAEEMIEMFCDEEVYRGLQPYKGASRVIKTLIEHGHEVYIATASDPQNMAWKEQLLRQYFPFVPKDNLILIHNKKLLNVDVLVDDNLDNLIQTFADRVCFDQKWNRSSTKDEAYSIYRIHHWGEFTEVINKIERRNKEWER